MGRDNRYFGWIYVIKLFKAVTIQTNVLLLLLDKINVTFRDDH